MECGDIGGSPAGTVYLGCCGGNSGRTYIIRATVWGLKPIWPRVDFGQVPPLVRRDHTRMWRTSSLTAEDLITGRRVQVQTTIDPITGVTETHTSETGAIVANPFVPVLAEGRYEVRIEDYSSFVVPGRNGALVQDRFRITRAQSGLIRPRDLLPAWSWDDIPTGTTWERWQRFHGVDFDGRSNGFLDYGYAGASADEWSQLTDSIVIGGEGVNSFVFAPSYAQERGEVDIIQIFSLLSYPVDRVCRVTTDLLRFDGENPNQNLIVKCFSWWDDRTDPFVIGGDLPSSVIPPGNDDDVHSLETRVYLGRAGAAPNGPAPRCCDRR